MLLSSQVVYRQPVCIVTCYLYKNCFFFAPITHNCVTPTKSIEKTFFFFNIQVEAISGRSFSYHQLKILTQRFSSALVRRGFKKGDVLAMYLPNVLEYPIIFYGVAFIGGIATTINPLYTSEELADQLRKSAAKYLVTIPPLVENAKNAAATEGIRSVFVLGEAPPGCESLSALFSDDGTAFPEHVDINPKEDVVKLP